MQAAGGSAGTYQAGSSEAVKKFEAEMMAYTDFWWAGNVIFHSLEQSFLTATSLQVCVVFVLFDRPTEFLCSRSRVSDLHLSSPAHICSWLSANVYRAFRFWITWLASFSNLKRWKQSGCC
jgi:hypothetical protein